MKSLVVEDDALARMLLSSILSKYGECHIAGNGEEAIKLVDIALQQDAPYDVMCLDILMPVLGGHEALREIREIEKNHGIREQEALKVIMVTAIEDFGNISQAFDKGHCEAYLTKPVDEQKLLEHLFELELINEQSS